MPARRSPRKKPAQRRSRDTVDALLTAAARILERDGYERASVNRIAELAGVSVGSLYQYFPSKEALAVAVAQRLTVEMLAVFQEGLAEVVLLPFDEAIRAVALRTVRSFRVSPRLREVIVGQLPESLLGDADFDRLFAGALEVYLGAFADRLRPRDLGLAVTILVAAVEAAAKAAASRGEPEETVASELACLITGYLLPAP